ncbi:MAG: hypothetical protein BWY75_01948 [bacterium ADurb.Bin425]|nr:MAG: hypothetical protein BWY75_01948 [bacterium ADurb.Bin425]
MHESPDHRLGKISQPKLTGRPLYNRKPNNTSHGLFLRGSVQAKRYSRIERHGRTQSFDTINSARAPKIELIAQQVIKNNPAKMDAGDKIADRKRLAAFTGEEARQPEKIFEGDTIWIEASIKSVGAAKQNCPNKSRAQRRSTASGEVTKDKIAVGDGSVVRGAITLKVVDAVQQRNKRHNQAAEYGKAKTHFFARYRPGHHQNRDNLQGAVKNRGNILQQVIIRAQIFILARKAVWHKEIARIAGNLIAAYADIVAQFPAGIVFGLIFKNESIVGAVQLPPVLVSH